MSENWKKYCLYAADWISAFLFFFVVIAAYWLLPFNDDSFRLIHYFWLPIILGLLIAVLSSGRSGKNPLDSLLEDFMRYNFIWLIPSLIWLAFKYEDINFHIDGFIVFAIALNIYALGMVAGEGMERYFSWRNRLLEKMFPDDQSSMPNRDKPIPPKK